MEEMIMNRKYIPRFTVDGVPTYKSIEYIKEQVEEYLKEHKGFNNYLIELSKALEGRYKELNELFDKSYKSTSKVLGKTSIFNTLVKLYNYHFSIVQTCNYIDICYDIFKKILNSRFEVRYLYPYEEDSIEFEIGVVFNDTSEYKDYWPLSIYLNLDREFSSFGLKFDSDVERIEDGYILFDNSSNILDISLKTIYSNYLEVIEYIKELKPIIMGKTKLTISNIQKECGLGFKLSKEIYRKLKQII